MHGVMEFNAGAPSLGPRLVFVNRTSSNEGSCHEPARRLYAISILRWCGITVESVAGGYKCSLAAAGAMHY